MTTKTAEIRSITYAAHCSAPNSSDSVPRSEWDSLADATRAALQTAYPEASVEVEVRFGVSGHGSGTTYSVDGERDDERSADANAIAERAWERWCATMPTERDDG